MYQPRPLLDHQGPWTAAEYLALPEVEGLRIELVDGELILGSVGANDHQRVLARLLIELDRLLPQPYEALPGVGVRLGSERFGIPDVAVLREPADAVFNDAADVPLVVEIVSDTGRARDRIFKPALYAEAGITWYLIVERRPRLEQILFRLDGGEYVEHARAGIGERLELPGLGIAVETDALTCRSR